MAKRLHMQPFSSRENQPPPSDSISTWTTADTNFQELGKGFYPPNTTADICKCAHTYSKIGLWGGMFDKVPDAVLATDNDPKPIPSVHRNTQGSWHSLSSTLYLDDNFKFSGALRVP